ncbi:hypothetical protein [Hahella ganghwensis]|uniref:hypothetical protein n=1 Tax=Hahella ganghwensis TaxID=286420 RepID=UPI00039F77FD|nr:hypothetical protein [Hahella ganghwensis]
MKPTLSFLLTILSLFALALIATRSAKRPGISRSPIQIGKKQHDVMPGNRQLEGFR